MKDGRDISGVVCSGLGEGAAFISLVWVQKILSERLGFVPYPATLNLRLESEEEVASWKEILAKAESIEIPPPDSNFCHARCLRAQLVKPHDGQRRKIECAVLVPQVANYAEDKVEIIAPVYVKEYLCVCDGEKLTLKFL